MAHPIKPNAALEPPNLEVMVRQFSRVVGTLSAFPAPTRADELCDIVEVRLDLTGETPDWLNQCRTIMQGARPVLLTIRMKAEGGQWAGDEARRLELFKKGLAEVAAVDVEWRSSIARDVCDLARAAKKAAIVSFHDFAVTPPLKDLEDVVTKAQQIGSIVKIVTMTNTTADVATLRALLEKKWTVPLCVMGMGAHGAETRVEFPKLGSCLAYGYLDKPLAPGQTSAAELMARLRTST